MVKDSHVPYKSGPLAGMTHKQIMQQAKKDDAKSKKRKDPFAEGEKKYGSKEKMYKDSMKHLGKLLSKSSKKSK